MPEDSLSWATLLKLERGVGAAFTDYVYHLARERRARFGRALLSAYDEGLSGAPQGSRARVERLLTDTRRWLLDHGRPENPPEAGWGHWIGEFAANDVFPGFSSELAQLLLDLDAVVEVDLDLSRYLSQVGPLGSDIVAARAGGVRIMNMTKSKGLTVEATIVAACEDNVIPRPDCPLDEERRLLYVAMTRSRRFLYCTWARQRTGPTARAGTPRVLEHRTVSSFLGHGPVTSRDGHRFMRERWLGEGSHEVGYTYAALS